MTRWDPQRLNSIEYARFTCCAASATLRRQRLCSMRLVRLHLDPVRASLDAHVGDARSRWGEEVGERRPDKRGRA